MYILKNWNKNRKMFFCENYNREIMRKTMVLKS